MIKQLSSIILLSGLCGCSDVSTPGSTIPVHTGHKDITSTLINELENNDDWYRSVDSTTIEVSNPPPSYLIAFVESEANKIIPKNRSFSVSSALRKSVYEQLTAKYIDYRVTYYDGDEWIIWQEEDTDKVHAIIDSVAEAALDAKLSK